ncbi:carbon-nitrogen hydrolase family protein [Actinoplanes sp. NPDC026623]|uniref:carbon-nitrogen hydrolase family protein n=1 Tax=Actinoplanes sp. NPDC026623 TaxID=3155610 RepID=UPI0033D45871
MRIACWQAACEPGTGRFLERLDAVAARAAAGGAELLVTPEMSVGGYPLSGNVLAEVAGPADAMAGRAVRRIAREHGLAIVYGWPETDEGRLLNAVRLVDRTGNGLARYRKTHLYRPAEPQFTPGSDAVVQARLGELTVGLLICYDVEFPEIVRAHALAGTELLVVPTALMAPWELVARILVPARAFESQLYVAYTNWLGVNQGVRFCGLSTVAAPDGGVSRVEEPREELLFAEIDRKVIAAARATTGYLTDRRPELYGPVTER